MVEELVKDNSAQLLPLLNGRLMHPQSAVQNLTLLTDISIIVLMRVVNLDSRRMLLKCLSRLTSYGHQNRKVLDQRCRHRLIADQV